MIELVGLIGLVFAVVLQILDVLFQLDCGGTLQAAFVLIPLLAGCDLWRLRRLSAVSFLQQDRAPLPPEKFYWPVMRGSFWRQIVLLAGLVPSFWVVAVLFPARWMDTRESLLGWVSGAGAVVSSARLLSVGFLYVDASQHMDRFTPGLVGLSRRLMFRLTDNREYLGREK